MKKKPRLVYIKYLKSLVITVRSTISGRFPPIITSAALSPHPQTHRIGATSTLLIRPGAAVLYRTHEHTMARVPRVRTRRGDRKRRPLSSHARARFGHARVTERELLRFGEVHYSPPPSRAAREMDRYMYVYIYMLMRVSILFFQARRMSSFR